MKKIFSFLILGMFFAITACADREVISQNVNDLPQAARTTLTQHFAAVKLSYIKIEKESLRGTTYEVRLDDGAEIKFNTQGERTEVERKGAGVPAGFVPKSIADYVQKSYPGCVVTKIEKARKGYEVELSNDLDLRFNKSGKLVGVD